MTEQIVQLREPFKTFFASLDRARFNVCPHTGRVDMGNSTIGCIPPLDADEARALANELDAAVAPVLERFKKKKLDEVFALMAGHAKPVARVG